VELEVLTNDKHVNIFFDPVRVKQIEAESKGDEKKPSYAPEFLQRAKFENNMMRKAERMDGNVGYLKFNAFVDLNLSKRTLVAAMNLLENSSALIVDLRQNGGGDGHAVTFLLNYFLPDSTLISLRKGRSGSNTAPHYTTHDAVITKFDKNVPLYILTSKRTSSAAEAFAYTLQSFKRAVVVGDTTKGEANPGYLFPLNKEMYIMIPAFENINPITKTNWQGKGVVPDIIISADKALAMAQARAYEALAATTPVTELKAMYSWMATGLWGELQPPVVSEDVLRKNQGEYADGRVITFAEGTLFYERKGNPQGKKKMRPLTPALFSVEGVPYFRVQFVKNEKGAVVALHGIYDDGTVEKSLKL
jgi:C-terminal processing protease CtpA/Prc